MKFKLYKKVPKGPPDGGWKWVNTGEVVEEEQAARYRGAMRSAMPPQLVRAELIS